MKLDTIHTPKQYTVLARGYSVTDCDFRIIGEVTAGCPKSALAKANEKWPFIQPLMVEQKKASGLH